MPNPKKEHGDKKTHNMKVLLDDAQYALVQSAANAAGMKMAAYMRNQAIYGKIEIHNHIVANFSSLERISAELSSISNNLNQLTRYFPEPADKVFSYGRGKVRVDAGRAPPLYQ